MVGSGKVNCLELGGLNWNCSSDVSLRSLQTYEITLKRGQSPLNNRLTSLKQRLYLMLTLMTRVSHPLFTKTDTTLKEKKLYWD